MRATIDLFFVVFPTPSALLQADIQDVQELLDPVGLQETRRQVLLLGLATASRQRQCGTCEQHMAGVQEGCPGHDTQLLCRGGRTILVLGAQHGNWPHAFQW